MKKHIQTAEKADACVHALASVMMSKMSIPRATSTLKSRLGSGWTFYAAMQWLAGKSANEYFKEIPEDSKIAQIPLPIARTIAGFAEIQIYFLEDGNEFDEIDWTNNGISEILKSLQSTR